LFDVNISEKHPASIIGFEECRFMDQISYAGSKEYVIGCIEGNRGQNPVQASGVTEKENGSFQI
jgi:hypothetical protein